MKSKVRPCPAPSMTTTLGPGATEVVHVEPSAPESNTMPDEDPPSDGEPELEVEPELDAEPELEPGPESDRDEPPELDEFEPPPLGICGVSGTGDCLRMEPLPPTNTGFGV